MQCTLQTNMQTINTCFARSNVYGDETKRFKSNSCLANLLRN